MRGSHYIDKLGRAIRCQFAGVMQELLDNVIVAHKRNIPREETQRLVEVNMFQPTNEVFFVQTSTEKLQYSFYINLVSQMIVRKTLALPISNGVN